MFGKSANHNFVMSQGRKVGNVKTAKAPAPVGKAVHPKPNQKASAPAGKNTTLKIQPALVAQTRKKLGK